MRGNEKVGVRFYDVPQLLIRTGGRPADTSNPTRLLALARKEVVDNKFDGKVSREDYWLEGAFLAQLERELSSYRFATAA
jgi:hypothetical protein